MDHCVQMINKMRETCGGKELCVYKVGITHNAIDRFQLYLRNGFKKMWLIHITMNLSQVECIESHLISIFKGDRDGSCRNQRGGGEGMRVKDGSAKYPAPYFVYVVAARADQREAIGS